MTPRYSVITPVYNPPPDVLRACIESVRNQWLGDWQLCLVDDASTAPGVHEVLRDAAAIDRRIEVRYRDRNGGIVEASNDALEMATGTWVAFLDHDDLLTPHALAAVDAIVETDETIDYCYSDEDHIDRGGRFFDPFHKPDWSPERLRSQNYTCHLSVMRRSLVDEVGRFRHGFDGAQDYDLILRVTERARRVEHAQQVLYHWRMGEGSTSGDATSKPYAYEAGRRAVADHCARVGIDAEVEPGAILGVQRLRRRVHGEPLVSIVIPTRGSVGRVWGVDRIFVIDAVRSVVERSTYQHVEIVVVADVAMDPAIVTELDALAGDRLRVVWYDKPFNFSDKVNVGALAATGDLLLFLNDDIEVIDADWLETMVAIAQEDDVGAVGARLLFADGTLQHAGHLYNGGPTHIFGGRGGDEIGPSGLLVVQREVSGVTAACLMTRREVFESVGGFTTSLPENFNDVDFCLKLRHRDLRIVYTPYASLHHFESQTRVPLVKQFEIDFIMARWAHPLAVDPYSNPNFAHDRNDWVVQPPVDVYR